MLPVKRLSRALRAAVLLLALGPTAVLAEAPKMSAPDAYSAVQADDVIILDIRSPAEWAATGVAKGAWPVTMHDANFSANLQRIFTQFPNKTVALICATGGRSDHVAEVLEQNGISGVVDISEGMFGNGQSPGWIARDLPIVDVDTAQTDLTRALKPTN